jgi:spore maturation protein CgeB
MGAEIQTIDYHHLVQGWQEKVNTQMYRLPDKWRLQWESYYFKRINAFYLEEYKRLKPDLVFIYNSELILPDTLIEFKKGGSKVAFFLGDCPYYTPASRHFLPLLFHADAIYTYDSFWVDAMKKLGIRNIHYFYPNLPVNQHFVRQLSPERQKELQSEILYVGMCYKTSWGLKKAKFLSCFSAFDLQIHGDESWKRWFDYYPELKKCYRPRQGGGHISVEHLNDMYNATKFAPVDANPGLLHAIHWRFAEALCSGTLPVLEWQKNVEEIFGNADVPAVRNFEEVPEIIRYYLNNESKRVEKVAWMRKVMEEKYSIPNNADFLSQTLLKKITG